MSDIKTNILNIGQLLERGFDMQLKEGSFYLRKHDKLIAHVPMSNNRMFVLNINHVIAKCLSACMKDVSYL